MIAAIIGLHTAMLRSSDAQMAMMNNSQARMNLAFKASNPMNMANIDVFQRQDKNLMLENQQAYTMYMMNTQLERSYQQLLDKKLKDFAPKFV